MTIKNKIKPNEELYGDFADKLIPLNLDAVQQRIDFFEAKCESAWEERRHEDFNAHHKDMNFWIGMKKEHCEVEV